MWGADGQLRSGDSLTVPLPDNRTDAFNLRFAQSFDQSCPAWNALKISCLSSFSTSGLLRGVHAANVSFTNFLRSGNKSARVSTGMWRVFRRVWGLA